MVTELGGLNKSIILNILGWTERSKVDSGYRKSSVYLRGVQSEQWLTGLEGVQSREGSGRKVVLSKVNSFFGMCLSVNILDYTHFK